MRFGTYFFLQAAPGRRHAEIIQRELDQMVLSEELGFDEVWLTEHHFIDYGLSVDPATLASAVASRTSRVRIGLAAAILPFHDPIRIAEQLALVDIISGGRLDVGVGRGNRPSEFIGYRIPQVESRERFDEAVQIIQRAWTAERFSYDGRYFQIPEVRVIPKPLQRPHPPLYQVCVSPDSIEGTALRGWPMLNSLLFGGVEQLVASRDRYVATLQKAGRSAGAMAARLSKITWEGLVAETLAFGSPDTVARHIEQMRQMGVGQLMCWMNFGGLPEDKVRRSMDLFAREVLPRFK